MIAITIDPTTGQQQLNFANGSSSPLPVNPGFYISSSACGAGKTTLIADMAKRYSGEGVLIIASTRNAADEIGAKIPGSFVLHTDNLANLEQYRNNPTSLMFHQVLIITAARAIIDPSELFLRYGLGNRKWVLIDELITFFPEPFEVPEKVKDALTYVDTTKVHRGSVLVDETMIGKKHYYRHTYSKKEAMEAAYKLSKDKIFTGKSELVKYKERKILEHVRQNGFAPINQNIIAVATTTSTVILFDGTSDIVFPKSKRHLPLSGTRYSSDITFSTFPMPLKRKNKERFDVGEIDKYAPDFIRMVVNKTQTVRVIVITWKTVEVYKNTGDADRFEKTTTDDFPDLLKDLLVKNGAIEDNLAVIYRGSGLDRGSNEYKDYSTVYFLGEWRVPDNVTKDIGRMFDEKPTFLDYKMSLLVQTICRLRIRQHHGLPIEVFFSDDCNYELFYRVQEYFKANSPSTCKISGLNTPCPTYSSPQKGFIFDMVALYSYDPNLRTAIINQTPYSLSITLNEIWNIIPRNGKHKGRYKPLINYLKKRQVTLTIT